jgi:hypothetical protein
MSKDVPGCVLVAILVMISVTANTPAAAQEGGEAAPLVVACSPEIPLVPYGKAVRLRAWATALRGQPLQYVWAVPSGYIEGQGPEVQWAFADSRPGLYTATVRLSKVGGNVAECSLRVIVQAPIRDRLPLETGRSFLGPEQQEAAGYGLYSYVLFGSPPQAQAAGRYLDTIKAYLQLVAEITSLVKHLPRAELNVTYVPVTQALPGQGIAQVSAEWVLQHYDYARARVLLRALPGNHRDGPYIVSTLQPLSSTVTLADSYLYQDLTPVPPHLLPLWVKEFMNQAAQERFWEQQTTKQLGLKLRTTVGVLAEGLPEVRESLQSLIAWVQG